MTNNSRGKILVINVKNIKTCMCISSKKDNRILSETLKNYAETTMKEQCRSYSV